MVFFQKVKDLVKDPVRFQALERYVKLIHEFGQKFNLTAWSESQIWEHGVYQSLVTFKDWVSAMETKPVLDIGAGAGFPSLPLKIVHRKIQLTIYEANSKKVSFLNVVKRELNLDFKVLHVRAEESQDRDSFAFVLARAVSDLKHLIQMSYHLGAPGSRFLFVKGPAYHQEIKACGRLIKTLKLEIKAHQVEGQVPTYLVSFSKVCPTPTNFPPPWSKMDQA
ncbi:16S rRNA (guanine(527)-N(7))-methyltransferase RsmG [Mycoplasma sp. ATU-Cv-508]|uniref:16S rRNA (guanine(527)-N(7))-methyltransferase RsmG n=1 Tax=Mycoplasma sp. ATU-Cv-508 TaxID=2048001 RepID=UPI000FDCFB4C